MSNGNAESEPNYVQWTILGSGWLKEDRWEALESCERRIDRAKRGKCSIEDSASISERYDANFLRLFAGMSREGGQKRVDNETLIEFLKSGYVIGAFVPNLVKYAEEGNFIQEDQGIVKKLQRICRGGNDRKQLWVFKCFYF